jgi:hypothetical protein
MVTYRIYRYPARRPEGAAAGGTAGLSTVGTGGCRGSVVVHKSLVREAAEALAALELPRLPVKGVGGCLVPEVWLPMNDQ